MTTLFIVSMFGIFALLASKSFELKVRKIHFLSNIFSKGDEQIHRFIESALVKYNLYRKIAHIFVFDFLPSYLYEMIVKIKDYVARKYYEAGNDFRGKRILKSTGSVSFFLKRLSEE
jgi:hypothetical protein